MMTKDEMSMLQDGVNDDTRLNPQYQMETTELTDLNIRYKKVENEGRRDERGWLGRFWGADFHSSNNIAGLSIILLIVVGTIYMLCKVNKCTDESHAQIVDFWKILTPIIAGALGFLFGKHEK